MAWGWVKYQQILIFGWTISLILREQNGANSDNKKMKNSLKWEKKLGKQDKK